MVYRERTKDGVTRLTGGSTGGGGGSSGTVSFAFPGASTLWTCTHNLGASPVDVTTVDTNGDIIFGDVDMVNANTVTISWYYATAGTAIIQH